MPIWSEILTEIGTAGPDGNPIGPDAVRKKHLVELFEYTGRPTILYASGWLQKEAPELSLTISDEDIQGLMEVTAGLGHGSTLDLIIHSPGGSITAAEAIVSYLRSRFAHIRAIVPNLAMSAATMISCAADEIFMGKHSFLGPTDPQLALPTPLGMRLVPAQAILDQFDLGQSQVADRAKLASWLPMLSQYGPDLLVQCEESVQMSRELVRTWLGDYMFKDSVHSRDQAKKISDWLANHANFKSHGRHISRSELANRGLNIKNLEDDDRLQDLYLSIFHATTHTFSLTSATKIIENHTGRAFVKQYFPQ